jgi:hypothetical protein
VTDIFVVLHGLVMHATALAFVGIVFLSISGTLHHEIIGEGFIDDTGIGTTNPYSTAITSSAKKKLKNEEQTLHKKINDIIQFFLNLLPVIGGELNTSKSASFILFHRWSGGKSSLLRKHDSHPEITFIHPYTRVRTIVPRKEKDEPHCALGWMMTIDVKSTAQHKVLFDKARLFA